MSRQIPREKTAWKEYDDSMRWGDSIDMTGEGK